MNDLEVWRLSFVRMYYSKKAFKIKTPDPFVELRVFVFTETEPSEKLKRFMADYFKDIIDKLELLFPSIVKSKKYNRIFHFHKWEKTSLRIKKKTEKIVIEIDGYEVEKIDIDEVKNYFKKKIKKIEFNRPYRYVAFFDEDGNIRIDYDEWDIIKLERKAEEELKEFLKKFKEAK